MSGTVCPNRNYCTPDKQGCPSNMNSGALWFNAGIPGRCPHLFGPVCDNDNAAQTLCDNFANDFGGGKWTQACVYDEKIDGDCVIKGARKYICVKKEWNEVNKLACCVGEKNNIADCDPKWCPGNLGVCTNVLSGYCNNPNTVEADPVCRQFCSIYENKKYCDEAMQSYCNQNRSSDRCACFASGHFRPSCFDFRCTQTGYQTAQMVDVSRNCGTFCGAVINCVNNNTCTIDRNVFFASCPNATLPPEQGDDRTPLIPLNPPDPTQLIPLKPVSNNTFMIQNYILIGFIVATVVLVIIILAFAASKRARFS